MDRHRDESIGIDRNLRAAVRLLLLFLLSSVCFLDYWAYSALYRSSPDWYMDVVHGTANAPQQYRVLVARTAYFLHSHAHMGMRHAFALIDFVSALLACFILLHLLERSQSFRASDRLRQALGYAAYLFLCAYALLWLTWYQRTETLATAALLSLMLLVLSRQAVSAMALSGAAVALLALSFAQALVRADISVCLFVGAALTAMAARRVRLPQPRVLIVCVSVAAVLEAAAVQWWMMHRVYPNATYGDTKVVQIGTNLQPLSIVPFLLFMLPSLWTAWKFLRSRPTVEPYLVTPLFASACFLPLWFIVGRIAEVRIFLPFALTLAPLTVLCLLNAIRDPSEVGVTRAVKSAGNTI